MWEMAVDRRGIRQPVQVAVRAHFTFASEAFQVAGTARMKVGWGWGGEGLKPHSKKIRI